MKGIVIFIGGFLAGVFVTLISLFVMSVNTHAGYLEDRYNEENVQVQYIDVKGKKGRVTLHIGMAKDSVKILVGKPDVARLNTIGNTAYEEWGYKIKKDYITDLDINFEDGKLTAVRQD